MALVILLFMYATAASYAYVLHKFFFGSDFTEYFSMFYLVIISPSVILFILAIYITCQMIKDRRYGE